MVILVEAFLADSDAWIVPVTVGPAFSHRQRGQPLDVDDRTVP